MLNGSGWSRRDHADWYTVLTDPDNDDRTTKSICTSKCIMLCKDLKKNYY